jgi:hypothetical protein
LIAEETKTIEEFDKRGAVVKRRQIVSDLIVYGVASETDYQLPAAPRGQIAVEGYGPGGHKGRPYVGDDPSGDRIS